MGMRTSWQRSCSKYDLGKRKLSMSLYDTQQWEKNIAKGNPDPENYEIVRTNQVGNHLVMLVRYPDCSNYEGNKVLLFKDTTLLDIKKQKVLDPHFCDNEDFISPFARFEPTTYGYNVALQLAGQLGGKING